MQIIHKHTSPNSFIIIQTVLSFLLFLSLIISNSTIIFVIFVSIIFLCFLSYFSLYKICKSITHHAELEAQNALYLHLRKMQDEHLIATNENIENIHKIKKDIYMTIASYGNFNIHDQNETKALTKKLVKQASSLYTIDYSSFALQKEWIHRETLYHISYF